jgi:hypothetical protein
MQNSPGVSDVKPVIIERQMFGVSDMKIMLSAGTEPSTSRSRVSEIAF